MMLTILLSLLTILLWVAFISMLITIGRNIVVTNEERFALRYTAVVTMFASLCLALWLKGV